MRRMPLKNTPARKAIAVTAKFQYRHPETVAQAKAGRITTAKRFHHFQEYVKAMVENEEIRGIILKSKNEVEASNAIVNHLLKKTGSQKNALEELKRIRRYEVANPFSNSRFGLYREALKHAKKVKTQKDKIKEHAGETNHIISTAHQGLIGILGLAELQLEILKS